MSKMVRSSKDVLARVGGLVLTKKATDIKFITQIIAPYTLNAALNSQKHTEVKEGYIEC